MITRPPRVARKDRKSLTTEDFLTLVVHLLVEMIGLARGVFGAARKAVGNTPVSLGLYGVPAPS